MDTLTTNRENMRNLMCGESDSVPYKERVGGSSPSTPTSSARLADGFIRGVFCYNVIAGIRTYHKGQKGNLWQE